MKLNHLDLQVPDVQQLAEFLVRHFDFERQSSAHSPALVFLSDREGFSLVLQRSAPDFRYPETFHLGFLVDAPDRVTAHHARLVAAGLELGPVTTNNRGTMFYFRAPADLLIEVSCRPVG